MIDIKKVLSEHDVFFVEKGGNVARGNVNIKCPICGSDDKSEHMGIRLSDGAWACWRNSKHRGKNLARLLQILDIPYIDSNSEILKGLLNRTLFSEEVAKIVKMEEKVYTDFPLDFEPITGESVFDKPYLSYLTKRGIEDPVGISKEYYLMRSLGAGKWNARLILPIFVKDQVSWTGRAIGNNTLRYLTPSGGEALNVKNTIWNYNKLIDTEGETLLIGEGILDIMNADYSLRPHIRGTAVLGLSITEEQISLLSDVCPNFDNILIVFDQDTLAQSLELARYLGRFGPMVVKLPKKDMGEMTTPEIKKLIGRYI